MSCGCGTNCNTTQLPGSTTPGPAGPSGTNGSSVIGANINPTGTLTLSLSDGSNVTATGSAQGPQGIQGVAGTNGIDGTTGKYILAASGQDIINNGNSITLSPSLIDASGVADFNAALSLTWSNVIIGVTVRTVIGGTTAIVQSLPIKTTTAPGWELVIGETGMTMAIDFSSFPINADSTYKIVIV